MSHIQKGPSYSGQLLISCDGDHIDQTTEKITLVSNAFNEQKEGIFQISQNIVEIGDISSNNAKAANEIDALSKEIENLTKKLLQVSNNAKFKQNAKYQICNPDMLNYLNALKIDHINFKDSAFSKASNYEKFKVKSANECRLGKWIKEMEEKNAKFTKTQIWQELKKNHIHVHKDVQNFVDENSIDFDNQRLFKLGEDTEKSILKTFELVDEVKRINCQN